MPDLKMCPFKLAQRVANNDPNDGLNTLCDVQHCAFGLLLSESCAIRDTALSLALIAERRLDLLQRKRTTQEKRGPDQGELVYLKAQIKGLDTAIQELKNEEIAKR